MSIENLSCITVAVAFGVLIFAASGHAQNGPTDAAAPASISITAKPDTPASGTAIRPFHFNASDEALADLRRRIVATRWPDKETVADASQGVPLATMGKLAQRWGADYDRRKCERKLNALPQFM